MSSIGRPSHMMKREKSLAVPRHFIFFDTETSQHVNEDNTTTQTFKLGWACYYRRAYGRHLEAETWQYLSSPAEFWAFAFSHVAPKQKLWIIARNVVFDFTIVKGWTFLKAEGYKLKFFHNTGVCTILSVSKKGLSIVCLDSMNWFTESLAKTGERIGIPKMKIDFENCSMEELSVYCKNDVLIELENFKSFISFLQGNQISRVCYTKASTAMAAYLFRHYHTPIYIHNNAEAIRLERESYKGGRCEAFQLGELQNGPYYILDVNSLYPYVMRENQYPVKYKKLCHQVRVEELSEILQSFCVVAKVRIQTDEPAYAIKRDRTIFPVGTFVATLCTPELAYALRRDHVVEVLECVYYLQANIFESYVDSMYALRFRFKDEQNEQFHVLCKYLLNSLYGKFGQKGEQWEKIGDAPNEPDREEILFGTHPRIVRRLRYLLGEIFELKGYDEAYDSFPAIAAHVTAFGRMHLWSLMQKVGSAHFFYCDTDSLLVDGIGVDRLKEFTHETNIGALKVEKESDHVIILGLKDYTFGDYTRLKGIRKKAKKIDDSTYSQEMWPSFRGLLRSGDAETYKVKEMIKHLSRDYTKGDVLENGRIVPFNLHE